MAYLGFADGLFGSHYLRFNLGLFIRVYIYNYICIYIYMYMVVLMLLSVYFLCYVVPILWLVWCLFDVL
jgi:hypothetical protein